MGNGRKLRQNAKACKEREVNKKEGGCNNCEKIRKNIPLCTRQGTSVFNTS